MQNLNKDGRSKTSWNISNLKTTTFRFWSRSFIRDGIVRAYGLANAQYGELVEFDGGLEGIVLNLEEDNVGIVLLGGSVGIKEGSTVKRTSRIASINVEQQ